MAGSLFSRLLGGSRSNAKKLRDKYDAFQDPKLNTYPDAKLVMDDESATVSPADAENFGFRTPDPAQAAPAQAPSLGGLSETDRTTVVAFAPRDRDAEIAPAEERPASEAVEPIAANEDVAEALAPRAEPDEDAPPAEAWRIAAPPPGLGIAPAPAADAELDSDGTIPRFRFLASEMSLASSGRVGSSRSQALQALREAFTPTQPKQTVRLFAGRRRELKRIVSAIEEWKAHIVIFGERGYGKSSLANIVAEIARQGGITVLSCACSADISFEEMFRNFLRDIPLPYRGVPGRGEGFKVDAVRNAGGNFASLLPEGPFGATELAETLRHLTDRHVIFRIDEFDRVRNEETKNQIAEAIKNLSDVGARVTFLIVGVADDLDDLLGRHPSIQRNVVGVHLSLMNESELLALIKAGEKAADLTFEEDVRARIVALAQGLPYQAQLLCQHAGQLAIEEGVKTVGPQHLAHAIDQALTLTPRALERVYDQAFAGFQHESLKAVAFAAALSPCDSWGYFCSQDLARAQRTIGTNVLNPESVQPLLDALADPQRGAAILRCRNDRAGRFYAYADPLLRAYVLLRMGRERSMF